MVKYRKKPVVIEAVQFIGDITSFTEIVAILKIPFHMIQFHEPNEKLTIITLEGKHTASRGDWIVKGVKGEFYPVKPDIFEQTYEKVD